MFVMLVVNNYLLCGNCDTALPVKRMQLAVTAEITKAVASENYSVALVRSKSYFYNQRHFIELIRVYFLTQQKRTKHIDSGKLDET
jgi:hypothetical protein